jgi:hypothetical protein
MLSGKFRIHHGDRQVGSVGMTDPVRLVMRERSERERVFLRRTRLGCERIHEIAGAHVVQQIGEQPVAQWKVSEIR